MLRRDPSKAQYGMRPTHPLRDQQHFHGFHHRYARSLWKPPFVGAHTASAPPAAISALFLGCGSPAPASPFDDMPCFTKSWASGSRLITLNLSSRVAKARALRRSASSVVDPGSGGAVMTGSEYIPSTTVPIPPCIAAPRSAPACGRSSSIVWTVLPHTALYTALLKICTYGFRKSGKKETKAIWVLMSPLSPSSPRCKNRRYTHPK
mmetsp:Transcript_44155/g.107913  ORF Transcript_44155/g.107913 Transcript_44155/m.107913 type:complete len:207 (+) Transcript_44155:48-668(+)